MRDMQKITAEEYAELWRRCKGGDTAARDALIVKFYPLVHRVAGKMRRGLPQHADADDIVSYGTDGLLRAIENFNPDQGVGFETYAVASIRGLILDELRKLDWAPRSLRKAQREIDHATSALEASLGRAPSWEEIAEARGMTPAEVRDVVRRTDASKTRSLDEPDDRGEEAVSKYDGLVDVKVASPEAAALAKHITEAVMEIIEGWGPQEQLVIALYYFEGMTLSDIARVCGIPESRASGLHTKTMLEVRARLTNVLS